jgi:hypothetical protein
MTHGHVHEEAEHASHHAENPFDKWVALTMVMIAALLAGVKVLGHRTHNGTLSYQIRAGDEQGRAGKAKNEAASWWAQFQSKKIRELFALQDGKMALRTAPRPLVKPDKPAKGPTELANREKVIEEFAEEVKKEGVKDADAKKAAEKAVEAVEKEMTVKLNAGFPRDRVDDWVKGELTAARYRVETKAIMKKAIAAEEATRDHENNATEYRERSEHLHHQADWFDLAELAVELGIVICSVAILSKDYRFWYAGIVLAIIGALLATMGFFPDLFSGGHGAGH